MTPAEVEALLERYHWLDTARRDEMPTPRRRRRSSPESREIRAAIVRADIDRALIQLRQRDERLWQVIKLVHVIPYPDPTHRDSHDDRHWLAHHRHLLARPITSRRLLAAEALHVSRTTVITRCYEAYRLLIPWLS